jgi:uncharacterized protein (DUF1330 family)
VILEFPSMERLRAFYDSPEYAAIKAVRLSTANARIVAVDGIPIAT